ncbi:hypothetical protein [Endozoicomonas sp. GU-1]|uniref:hypothetical protein n=1 Tax=Endozoicomonas sp. GU-1 TaxID=3009078 RepID=UPI0022B51D94|nr:hypothetical protein [Endozoicomonas sp. GU-1]WBA83399.1 hypothetical protein O2T12_09875 [Endozoicomonas sp. GU-1]
MAVNSRVETSGENAHAGIGGGSVFGTVANTTAVNSKVETSGENVHAGIGGGGRFWNGCQHHGSEQQGRNLG